MSNVQQSSFGRTRSGKSPVAAALAGGVVLSGLVAGATYLLNDGGRAWLLAALVAAFNLPIFVVAVWAALVDRSTLKGATLRPDESVENAWLDSATNGAFYDVAIVMGLGLTILNLVPAARGLPANHAFTAVLLLIGLDVTVRYFLAKRGDA